MSELGRRLLRPRVLAGELALASLALAGCTSGSEAPSSSPAKSTTPAATATAPTPQTTAAPRTYEEIQQFGAQTFGDYEHVAEPGKYLPLGAHVSVDCVARGPIAAAPSAKGAWYHLAPRQPEGYGDGNSIYVAANTFWNQDAAPTGPLENQPAVDPRVPDCTAVITPQPGRLLQGSLSPEAP